MYFNSIKVRLELRCMSWCTRFLPFQFHKGTIRTQVPEQLDELLILFQFHKGTIRTSVASLARMVTIISIP